MDNFFNKIPPQLLESSGIEPMPMAFAYSETQFNILKKYIQDFESKLDSEHEVGLLLTDFGKSITMIVTEITYEESVLMVFKGYIDGREATLIQHVSQLNFLLTSVEIGQNQTKKPIGFFVPN